jgi:plastocyanin
MGVWSLRRRWGRHRNAIGSSAGGAFFRGALLGAAILPLLGMASDVPTIIQQHRAFSIAQVAVEMGTTLHFSNEDDFAHEVYVESPSFTFESDEQEPGQTLAITFTTRGHFTVHCHIHPKMHLDVDVQ